MDYQTGQSLHWFQEAVVVLVIYGLIMKLQIKLRINHSVLIL